MGCWILHDPDQDRAIFFDSVRERPLNHEAFIGADAREQAESFIAWLGSDGIVPCAGQLPPSRRDDPRFYTSDQIDEALVLWHDECTDSDGHLNARGWAFQATTMWPCESCGTTVYLDTGSATLPHPSRELSGELHTCAA